METMSVQIMDAFDMSNYQIQRIDLMSFGGFTCFRGLREGVEKGRDCQRMFEVEITVAIENCMVRRVLTRVQLMYLYMRQNPNRKALATMGNLMAYFCPILSLFLLAYISILSPELLFNLVDMIVPRQTQAQLLINSCTKTGNRWKYPPTLANTINTNGSTVGPGNKAGADGTDDDSVDGDVAGDGDVVDVDIYFCLENVYYFFWIFCVLYVGITNLQRYDIMDYGILWDIGGFTKGCFFFMGLDLHLDSISIQ